MNEIFTIWDLLEINCFLNKEKTALIENGEKISYLELKSESEKIAAWLEFKGFQRGDRIGIHLVKSKYEVAAMFAVIRIGGVFVNIHPGSATSQVEHIANDCALVALISDSVRLDRIGENISNITSLVEVIQVDNKKTNFNRTLISEINMKRPKKMYSVIDKDLAALMYTSGSTGQPKGVMLTHQNIIAGARSVSSYLRNQKNDIVLSILPFSFDYGLNQLTTMFMVGGTLVLLSSTMPSEIINNVLKEKVTGIALVPTIVNDMVEYLKVSKLSLPSLRYITNSGGRILDSVLKNMKKYFAKVDIVLMYGLTESFRSTWLPPHLFQDKLGAIGIEIPNAEVFVVDSKKGLCGPGVPGELLHRGVHVAAGYWNNTKATKEKFKKNKHLKKLIGDEIVVHSGDIVKRDDDGILWYVGRTDNLIKVSGFRVSPEEVEKRLLKSGFFLEVYVFGINDDRLGQKLAIISRLDKKINYVEKDFLRWCKNNMPSHQIPSKIFYFDDRFYRNLNNKVDGVKMKKIALSKYKEMS